MQAQQALLKEQNMAQANEIKAYQAQTGAQNDQANTKIDAFEAQTDRMTAQINAQKAGAVIQLDKIKALGEELDNVEKVINLRQVTKTPGIGVNK